VQAFCRRDIGRRHAELIALGWLGRGWLTAPWLFGALFPAVFRFEPYVDTDAASRVRCQRTFSADGNENLTIECTLKECSLVSRGVAFNLRLRSSPSSTSTGANLREITDAALLGIGCDLSLASQAAEATASADLAAAPSAHDLCASLNRDKKAKRMVILTVVQTIFARLGKVGEAVSGSVPLTACLRNDIQNLTTASPRRFQPRPDLWAREGMNEKWLQQIGGYWFADAQLQDIMFVDQMPSADDRVSFTFYFDPTEPTNSEDPTMNVNPEVIYCRLST
jgi:hypothetical protein